jgi:outer membrane lipoprotein LolB
MDASSDPKPIAAAIHHHLHASGLSPSTRLQTLQIYRLVGYFAVLLALLLGGCSTLPEPRPSDDPQALWEQRQHRLRELHHWTAVGRLALRTEDEAWNLFVHWKQCGDRYQIRFRGPIGLGLMELSGGPEGVVLRTSDHKTFHATSPEQLLVERVGWSVPVGGLRDWIVGRIPRDTGVHAYKIDTAGRLERLSQSGWNIRYLAYRQIGRMQLPKTVSLQNQRVSARIIVSQWILEA